MLGEAVWLLGQPLRRLTPCAAGVFLLFFSWYLSVLWKIKIAGFFSLWEVFLEEVFLEYNQNVFLFLLSIAVWWVLGSGGHTAARNIVDHQAFLEDGLRSDVLLQHQLQAMKEAHKQQLQETERRQGEGLERRIQQNSMLSADVDR